MANKKFSGEIEAVARNGKNFKIGEQWFSVFKAVQMNGAQKGDEVSFEYQEKDVGGTTFYNVQGNLTVTASGGGGGSTSSASSGGGGSGGRASGSEAVRQRSIVRQNSLTQANALLASVGVEFLDLGSGQEVIAFLLDTAREFEAYSNGVEE